MGWRKITKDDLQRGAIIRLNGIMGDGGYSMATIISTQGLTPHGAKERGLPYIKVARPYAYAHQDFDSNSPLLGSEVFEIFLESILGDRSDVEVFEGRDGIRTMIT